MNGLQPWTIDFETYYTDKEHGGYTLSALTCEEYVRDPRFEIIGFSLKPGNGQTRWFTGDLDYCRQVLKKYVQWDKAIVIGHNMSEFDAMILTEVIGVRPAAYGCTLQMARALHGGKQANSLAALCKLYGLPNKGDEVVRAINKRRADFTPYELQAYGNYCIGDTDLCWKLFNLFVPQFNIKDLQIASLFTKMFAEPRLHLDMDLLKLVSVDMAQRKAGVLNYVADMLQIAPDMEHEKRMALTQRELRSDAKFAAILQNEFGVDPPTKFSPKQKNPDGSPKLVFAFAKSDEGMTDLLDDEDEDVQALATARLGVKSTQAESRINRFLGIASRGPLPVPLAFGKTHTSRAAGTQKINMQNLSNGKAVNQKTQAGTILVTPDGVKRLSKFNRTTLQVMTQDGTIYAGKDVHVAGMRDMIVAPPGKRVVVVDSSQIELRVCHLLAGQMDTVELLRAGGDPYSSFATDIYGRPITKADYKERQHGKVGMLQLQYQAGDKSFRNAARIMGGIRLTEDESLATVQVYREKFAHVRKFWRTCQMGIPKMANGGGQYLDQWGLCLLEHNKITMPGRIPLVYTNLRQEMLEGFGGELELQWVYDDKEKRHMKKVYGGSITENLCQWLARHVVFDQMLEMEARWGTYQANGNGVVLTVHDEVVLVVDEDDAEACLAFSLETMKQPPYWWPQLPVSAEGGIGVRYSDAK